MTIDSPARPADRTRGAGALADLHGLIRAGELTDGGRLRELLEQLTDPLDVEAAGELLRSRRAWHRLAELDWLASTRIALLGSSTLDPLPGLVTAVAVRRGILPEIGMAGFNQWQLEVMAGAPNLGELRPRVVGCLLDDSAVFAGVTDPADVDQLAARCAEFPATLANWLSECRAVLGGLVVIATIALSPLHRYRLRSFTGRAQLEAAWLRMNADIAGLASSDTVVLSGWGLSSQAGATFATDRMRHVASHAYAPEYLRSYAEEVVRVASADLGRASKCLVLDLDDTLWGGVVGERGPAGLRLGGDYPGSAHTELQTLARDLSRQGVLLAVCSKNDEPVAAEAIAAHPDMVLGAESFAATRINWDSKPDNLQAIADELNIGLDALVFVDDNPVERDQMRRFVPQVRTVELPTDPASYASVLAGRDDFALLTLTDEDRSRTSRYRAEAGRRELARTSGSLVDYLASLASRLTVEALTPVNADRIRQLFGKTNQFNLTGIRYAAGEVTRGSGAAATRFYAARLTDRFGDHGLIAAMAIESRPDGAWSIENLVVSCRVFGRQLEDALIALVLRDAAGQGAPAVLGSFRASARNGRFADFYLRLGFAETAPGCYRHDLGELLEPPAWIDVSDNQEVFCVR